MRLGPVELRCELRDAPGRAAAVLRAMASVALALGAGALVLALAGLDPWRIYGHILEAGFATRYALSDTLVKATPIMLCALGVAIAFRMRLWNIGAEGQLLLGAWAAGGVALRLLPATTPRPLMLGAMLLAGATAGALWGGAAGLLKARFGVSEIITTLMLNYVAAQWLCYFVFGPWSEGGFQLTAQFPPSAWLPRLTELADELPALTGLTAHLGVLLALVAALALTLLVDRSRWGFELRTLGEAPRAALYAGMPTGRNLLLVMLLSGALAGLAGGCEVAGVVHRLQDRFSPGYGFTAIIVAWLAHLQPAAVVVVSVAFGGLLVGAKGIQPAGIAQLLEGLLLLVIVGSETAFRYRLVVRRSVDAGPVPEMGKPPRREP